MIVSFDEQSDDSSVLEKVEVGTVVFTTPSGLCLSEHCGFILRDFTALCAKNICKRDFSIKRLDCADFGCLLQADQPDFIRQFSREINIRGELGLLTFAGEVINYLFAKMAECSEADSAKRIFAQKIKI